MSGHELQIAALVAVILVATAIGSLLRKPRVSGGGVAPPFRRSEYLLSKAERAFFEVLQKAVGTDFLIFPKVRLEDLLYLPKGTQNGQSWINKVRQKHVDFVLCDPSRVTPVLVIELDDVSHERDEAQNRDGTKDSILEAAGLPLVRVRAKRSYDARELRDVIERLRLKPA